MRRAQTRAHPRGAPGSERNWDYRVCWLRNAFLVVRALNTLSEVGTMEDCLRRLRDAVGHTASDHVQPLHGIGLIGRIGRKQQAREIFEALLAVRNPGNLPAAGRGKQFADALGGGACR